jgi:hypothetical protein
MRKGGRGLALKIKVFLGPVKWHQCKFGSSVVDTSGVPFWKCLNDPNVVLSLGEDDSWKYPEAKISWHFSFNSLKFNLPQKVDDIAWMGYDGGSNIQDFCNKTLKLIDQEDYIGNNQVIP